MVTNGEKIRAYASACVGIRESPLGSNDGPELRKVLRLTQWQAGEAYCYFGALACVVEGFGGIEAVPVWLDRGGRCSVAYRTAYKAGKISAFAATGAIALFKGGETGHYHAGIVAGAAETTGYIQTVEFNSNAMKSPEGIGVFQHERHESEADYIIF